MITRHKIIFYNIPILIALIHFGFSITLIVCLTMKEILTKTINCFLDFIQMLSIQILENYLFLIILIASYLITAKIFIIYLA